MDPITLALITAGVGGLLGGISGDEKRKAIAAQRPIEAVKAKWYGFKGETPQTFKDPNMFAEIAQGALSGLGQGANLASLLGKGSGAGETGSEGMVDTGAKGGFTGGDSGGGMLGVPGMGSSPSGGGYLGGQSLEARPDSFFKPAPATSSPVLPRTLPPKAKQNTSSWQNLLPAANQYYVGR